MDPTSDGLELKQKVDYLMEPDDTLGWHDEPDVDESDGDAEVDDGGLLPVDDVDDVALARVLQRLGLVAAEAVVRPRLPKSDQNCHTAA